MHIINPNIEQHLIEDDYEIYSGFNNPWKDIITEQELYEQDGTFKTIIHEIIPKIVSVYKLNNEIVSYGMIFQHSNELYEGRYLSRVSYLEHIVLGFIGVWTKPEFRNMGFADKISSILSKYFSENLERIYDFSNFGKNYKTPMLFFSSNVPVEKILKNFTACDIHNIYVR